MTTEYDFSGDWEALTVGQRVKRLKALERDAETLQDRQVPDKTQAEIEALQEELGFN